MVEWMNGVLAGAAVPAEGLWTALRGFFGTSVWSATFSMVAFIALITVACASYSAVVMGVTRVCGTAGSAASRWCLRTAFFAGTCYLYVGIPARFLLSLFSVDDDAVATAIVVLSMALLAVALVWAIGIAMSGGSVIGCVAMPLLVFSNAAWGILWSGVMACMFTRFLAFFVLLLIAIVGIVVLAGGCSSSPKIIGYVIIPIYEE